MRKRMMESLPLGRTWTRFTAQSRALMNVKAFLVLVGTVAVLVAFVSLHPHTQASKVEVVSPETTPNSADAAATPARSQAIGARPVPIALASSSPVSVRTPDSPVQGTNKLERLRQTRERFLALAAGDPSAALRAAKLITDDNERETALLTLVTQWTNGELSRSQSRAQRIATYGLEAGLGMELADNPELAVLWANELTDGAGRQALLSQTAILLAASDPAAAFKLGEQVPQDQRKQFVDSILAGWASKDTEAALQYADQLPEADRDAAIQAIRTTAPVGIGTAITMKDGYPVIQQLLPGTPAELSGQLHPGDRILGLAQGDNAFVDTHGIALSDLVQMIRGEPGTTVQLQILPGDAGPGSLPQTISITRDQIKLKN